jgi:two-component system, OmpR family, response regulator
MRLLVVEDESRLALLLKRGLEERGYSVDVTGDSAEALWLATETDYDAIVLDVMLPSRRWAPVLLLTARDGIDDRVRGLDAGAPAGLARPARAEAAAKEFALLELSGTCAARSTGPSRADLETVRGAGYRLRSPKVPRCRSGCA